MSSLSGESSYITGDLFNNINFFVEFNPERKQEPIKIAATRQMSVYVACLKSEIFWNRMKSTVLIAAGGLLTACAFDDKYSQDARFIHLCAGVSLLGFTTLRYLVQSYFNSSKSKLDELSNQTERCAAILKSLNEEVVQWETERAGLSLIPKEELVEIVKKILANIPAIKSSCNQEMKILSKWNIARLKVQEELEILERRCSRMVQIHNLVQMHNLAQKQP